MDYMTEGFDFMVERFHDDRRILEVSVVVHSRDEKVFGPFLNRTFSDIMVTLEVEALHRITQSIHLLHSKDMVQADTKNYLSFFDKSLREF